MEEKKTELKKLELEREDQITRIFWAGLEIAALFAVPLLFAVLIILKTGKENMWLILFVSFVISWILVIFRFKKLSKKMKKLDKEIKDLKEEIVEEDKNNEK